MSSRLLNQSLGQLGQNDRRSSSGAASRNSPYNRSGRDTEGADGTWKHDMYQAHSSGRGDRSSFRGRDRRGSPSGALKPTAKLTIDNLHYEVSETELRDLFERIGPVVKAFVKYDKSGRSTGQAVVIYESADDASTAKGEYDGAKAKGQVISITQQMRADRPQGRTATGMAATSPVAGGGGKDLLSRFDLLSRLGESRAEAPRNAPKGPSASTSRPTARPGPQRGVTGDRNDRSTSNRNGSGTGGRGGKERRKPATQADLDAELEAFMKAPSGATPASEVAPNSTAASIHAVPPTEDVEMS